MWKRTENQPPNPSPEAPSRPAPPRRAATPERATIGSSIHIKGDLSGDEDLLIQGRIEGKITLRRQNVTVGRDGRVKADIHGKVIRVEGEVHGNLHGEEEVVIRASGRVQGNLVAPRVTLENGAKFKGAIDMDAAAERAPAKPAAAARTPTGAARPASQAAKS